MSAILKNALLRNQIKPSEVVCLMNNKKRLTPVIL